MAKKIDRNFKHLKWRGCGNIRIRKRKSWARNYSRFILLKIMFWLMIRIIESNKELYLNYWLVNEWTLRNKIEN